MPEPLTKLDARFSDPGAVGPGWDATVDALKTAELFWISTVRADGRPHVTPLVAVWLDGVIYFSTGASEQKAVNLRQHPHAVLTTGCNGWSSGLDVMVEGEAVRVLDDGLLRRLAGEWAKKWDGQWQYEVRDGCFHHDRGGEARVFSVTPAKILAFGKGGFSQTRYRF